MRRNAKKPSVFKMILKSIFVLGMATGWLFTAVSLVWMAFEEATDYFNTDAYLINRCDEYYYEREYAELLDYMHLYDAYDERYDVYWEVLDAYVDLQEYQKWQKVSETDIEDARKMEEMYFDRVKEAAKNCHFPQNQKYLDDFVERLQ